jgi:membrane protease YdiL (CAAX protease family)
MEHENGISALPQYRLGKILLIWTAAAIPMGILGWFVAPALAHDSQKPGFERLVVLTIGLIWQFVLVIILLYKETGILRWSTIKQHLWLTQPRSPKTEETRGRLWWWLVPVILLTAIYEMRVGGIFDKLWVSIFPFFAEPQGFALDTALSSPEVKAAIVGDWGLVGLFVISALFNTILGEELLFRGILLPRMSGVFGKWDWVANGILFGLYHLHQPWTILGSVIEGILAFALPSRYFRSSWFGIIAHSGQSIFFIILILGLMLGLA